MVGVFENQELEGEVDIYDSWLMITLWKKKKRWEITIFNG